IDCHTADAELPSRIGSSSRWLLEELGCRWSTRVQAGCRALVDGADVVSALVLVGRSEEQVALRIEYQRHDARPTGDGHIAHHALHRIVAGAVWSRARGPRKCGIRSVYER